MPVANAVCLVSTGRKLLFEWWVDFRAGWSRIDNRAARSRSTEHIIVRDVEGAIQAYRSQQKKATGKEDEAYAEVLQKVFPFDIPDVANQLQMELDRLSEKVPTLTWGATYLRQFSRILMTAKPATVYVKDVLPEVQLGLHVTSSREKADVLSLLYTI